MNIVLNLNIRTSNPSLRKAPKPLYASLKDKILAKDVLLKNKSKMNNEKTIEEINTEIQALWNEVDEKTNSILEVLKGVSYKNIRLIKASVERKVEEAINHSKLVL